MLNTNKMNDHSSCPIGYRSLFNLERLFSGGVRSSFWQQFLLCAGWFMLDSFGRYGGLFNLRPLFSGIRLSLAGPLPFL